MPTSVFDWIARVTMLVLAGLVTLSMLGSIAALSNEPGLVRPTLESDRPPVQPERLREENAPSARPQAQNGDGVAPAGSGEAKAARVEAPKRWLEAIAYALLALAGLTALLILMMWRAVRELRRIGDTLVNHPPRP